MQAVLEQELISGGPVATRRSDERMKKIGFFGSLFGCWHKRLTRPISDNESTYQACVECGARRRFDTESFSSTGPFYYPAKVGAKQALSI
jgi:hypothetical protein